jgi:hypothetical protein
VSNINVDAVAHYCFRHDYQCTVMSFHLFSQLPGELRRAVWRSALCDPQVIDFDACLLDKLHVYQPPGMLLACRESRIEALSLLSSLGQSGTSKKMFFNPEHDDIYLGREGNLMLRRTVAIQSYELDRIHHLTLSCEGVYALDVVRLFQDLWSLTIITNSAVGALAFPFPKHRLVALNVGDAQRWKGIDIGVLLQLNMRGRSSWKVPAVRYMEWKDIEQ